MNFYNGTKLLNMKDLNKETPEIFISTSNRSAGKTTFFGKYVVDGFLNEGKKFILLYRYAYEVADASSKFFDEISRLFFPNLSMSQKMCEKDVYAKLFLKDNNGENEEECGYAIALNKADNIKKCSHLLADATIMLFDEFQSESNSYTGNEIQKFQSIHTSIARGGGKQVKYLPVIMISNFVSLLNPYYSALGISERLQENTNYLRGEGWVLEQGYNETASKAQKESAFNRAFGNSNYNKYSSEKFYLNDNNSFIKKMKGSGQYILSFKYNGLWYGLRYYKESGILYANKNPDLSFPKKYAITVDDMEDDTTLWQRSEHYAYVLRNAFEKGQFRFANLESKSAVFSMLSY